MIKSKTLQSYGYNPTDLNNSRPPNSAEPYIYLIHVITLNGSRSSIGQTTSLEPESLYNFVRNKFKGGLHNIADIVVCKVIRFDIKTVGFKELENEVAELPF